MAFSSGGDGRGGPMSEINVTPMVDVMLVLLIIFMVSAPLLTTGVSVDLPNAEAPGMDVDEDLPLIVVEHVPAEEREQGGPVSRLYFFEDPITLPQLEARLRTDERLVNAESGEKEVFVQADERVPYGEVVRVLAIVRQVGIQKMGLVTDPLAQE
ncbi:MAG: biopolymer transporter ExbD [Myxococcota bacterium]